MDTLRAVRVAAVQATPVVLDAVATVENAAHLIEDAAAQAAELTVFPECFVSIYPGWVWAGQALSDPPILDEISTRLWEEAVEVPGPLVDQLVEA